MSKEKTIDKLADLYIELMNIRYTNLTDDMAKKLIKTAYADGMKAALRLKELLTNKK